MVVRFVAGPEEGGRDSGALEGSIVGPVRQDLLPHGDSGMLGRREQCRNGLPGPDAHPPHDDRPIEANHVDGDHGPGLRYFCVRRRAEVVPTSRLDLLGSEGHESDTACLAGPGEDPSELEDHGDPAGVVVGPGRTGHGVEARPDQDPASGGARPGGNDVSRSGSVGKLEGDQPGRVSELVERLADVPSRLPIPGGACGAGADATRQLSHVVERSGGGELAGLRKGLTLRLESRRVSRYSRGHRGPLGGGVSFSPVAGRRQQGNRRKGPQQGHRVPPYESRDPSTSSWAALRIRLGIVIVMRGDVSIDVGQEDFEARVLEASKEVPVVVDFWADWCQPCRILTPVLDRLAEEYGGRFVLAKLDVDASPAVAAMFGIQGIPAVKGFRDGDVVAEFVGVQPEEVIRRFLDQVAPDTALLEPAWKAEAAGLSDEAERLYREAVAANPNDEQAIRGLARALLARQADEEARSLLLMVPADAESRRLLAEIHLRGLAEEGGTLGPVSAAVSRGEYREALDRCLKVVADGSDERDAAREGMVAIFDLLGGEHPLSREYRPRLASALF